MRVTGSGGQESPERYPCPSHLCCPTFEVNPPVPIRVGCLDHGLSLLVRQWGGGPAAGEDAQDVLGARGGLGSELRGHLACAQWYTRCLLPTLQLGKLRPSWRGVSGPGPSAVPLDPVSSLAHLPQGLLEPRGGTRSSGVSVVAVGRGGGPELSTPSSPATTREGAQGPGHPVPGHWLLLDLIPLDEATLVLVQGLEGLADDTLLLPRGLELLHVLEELDVVEGAWG